MKTLHLFAGAGGGLLADLILGHEPIGAVEIEPYCCAVLRERIEDGWFPSLRVHECDIRGFDASEYAGRVDCVSGGFPCQDISVAGRGAGLDGERSGLWSEFARVLREVRPRFAFIENSPALVTRGLDRVLSDLASMGFDARWGVISAADAGAPHRRERIWIVADADMQRRQEQCSSVSDAEKYTTTKLRCETLADAMRSGSLPSAQAGVHRGEEGSRARDEQSERQRWWQSEPDVGRVADGVANRVQRLKALGNGQVPIQAALAWRILSSGWSH